MTKAIDLMSMWVCGFAMGAAQGWWLLASCMLFGLAGFLFDHHSHDE